ncbi:hypothetical protein BDU57DRAFT_488548 [Ampelomyces quisqualis]|uniref:Uncharacterized protein n=1 Tax=Ampelomyces quisqualis TaxID=50730 RepID=A0A6A5R5D8_AMPQU|nr:hypothetical protein BDU57DRAFT_488548 [Ampelomyces quisqualis]
MSTPMASVAMDTACPISPSTSATSTSSTISYTDSYARLPSRGPSTHAHIIDVGDYNANGVTGLLRLQDAAVTTLHNMSAEILETFLSPTINTFKAVFGKKDLQLVIWRKGLEVLVSAAAMGTFENHSSMKAFRFEYLAGFLIGYDGSWHLKVTATNAYCTTKWPDVWAGKFEDRGGVTKMSVEVEQMAMAKRASLLAEYMLETKFWELKADVKTT